MKRQEQAGKTLKTLNAAGDGGQYPPYKKLGVRKKH